METSYIDLSKMLLVIFPLDNPTPKIIKLMNKFPAYLEIKKIDMYNRLNVTINKIMHL
jgi:hypothetical protein